MEARKTAPVDEMYITDEFIKLKTIADELSNLLYYSRDRESTEQRREAIKGIRNFIENTLYLSPVTSDYKRAVDVINECEYDTERGFRGGQPIISIFDLSEFSRIYKSKDLTEISQLINELKELTPAVELTRTSEICDRLSLAFLQAITSIYEKTQHLDPINAREIFKQGLKNVLSKNKMAKGTAEDALLKLAGVSDKVKSMSFYFYPSPFFLVIDLKTDSDKNADTLLQYLRHASKDSNASYVYLSPSTGYVSTSSKELGGTYRFRVDILKAKDNLLPLIINEVKIRPSKVVHKIKKKVRYKKLGSSSSQGIFKKEAAPEQVGSVDDSLTPAP